MMRAKLMRVLHFAQGGRSLGVSDGPFELENASGM
jgi:hypothetical protein